MEFLQWPGSHPVSILITYHFSYFQEVGDRFSTLSLAFLVRDAQFNNLEGINTRFESKLNTELEDYVPPTSLMSQRRRLAESLQ